MGKRRTGQPKSNLKIDFEWSLRPFTVLLSCFGVPLLLKSFRQHSGCVSDRFRWWLLTSLGLLFFFFHALCQYSALAYRVFIDKDFFNHLSAVYGKLTSALVWNIYINFVNGTVLALGSHWLAMTCLLTNWSHVTQVLNLMKHQSFYNEQDYRRFRSATIKGVIASVLVILILIFHTAMFWPESSPTSYKLVHAGVHAFSLFIYISVFLFCSLLWIAKIMFNILDQRIKAQCSQNLSRGNWRQQLKVWKKQYFLINELVYHINVCFGPHLLLVLSCCFIKMTNNSFALLSLIRVSYFKNFSNLIVFCVLIYNLIQDLGLIGAITYTPHSIRQTAFGIIKSLRRLQLNDDNLQNQTNFLKMEMSLSLPQITAVGLVDVDCRLIPTLIGTTLTYLIILYQFDTMEKAYLVN